MKKLSCSLCSTDDDYDIYAGKELQTRADGMIPSNGESGRDPNDDPEGYANDIDNCGGVVLAQLHYGSKTDDCYTYTRAYYHIKQIAGGSCRNMTPDKILQVAQRIDGLNFSSCYSPDLNYDSAYNYINRLNSVYSKIKIIAHGAFSGCVRLQNVSIPEYTRILEQGAFAGCPCESDVIKRFQH